MVKKYSSIQENKQQKQYITEIPTTYKYITILKK